MKPKSKFKYQIVEGSVPTIALKHSSSLQKYIKMRLSSIFTRSCILQLLPQLTTNKTRCYIHKYSTHSPHWPVKSFIFCERTKVDCNKFNKLQVQAETITCDLHNP